VRSVALILLLVACPGCQRSLSEWTKSQPPTNSQRGEAAIERYGCAACHTIPGIRDANGLVGPSLDRIASRTYIAGVLPNTRTNMLTWIKDPPGVDDKTAMPKLNVSDAEASDIAAYLYTLR
jgi:cytochrome c1